jgi:putative CocE/NonD family hydrolase
MRRSSRPPAIFVAAIPLSAFLGVAILATGCRGKHEIDPPLGRFPNIKVDTDVAVPMRDGVVLRADLYRPDAPGRFPALLMRTPYGKQGIADDGSEPTVVRAPRDGYVVVVQDVRGRYASDGVFDPYRQEGRDGYDTVEWIAGQPWCDGRVGTFGLSYPGAVQWLLAMEAPPHLTAILPAMTFASGRHFFHFGGAFNHDWMRWISLYIAPEERRRRGLAGPLDEKQAQALWDAHKWEWERFLPLADLPPLKEVAPWYAAWLEHPDDGAFWSFADVTAKYDHVTVPALSFSAWNDSNYGPLGALRNYDGVRRKGATARARAGQRVVIGPWDHGDPAPNETRVGDIATGASAAFDYYGLIVRWHDRFTRGIDNGIDAGPPIRLFVMGENVWRDEREWPLERARPTAYHLRGGGTLSLEAPGPSEPADRYVYDPADPVVIENFEVMGPRDRSGLGRRRDVLSYATPPLDRDVEVTGPVEAHLFIASSAVDTDFMVMLLDVHPDGRAFNVMPIEAGVLRARYRDGQTTPHFLTPDRPTAIVIGDMVMSQLFRKGHRIGVQVTSSRFPVFERNLNTGEPPAHATRMFAARQTILHDAAHPSWLILPVVPR